MLERQADYIVPLLRLLAELPGGQGTRAEVSERFLERFRTEIPQEDFAPVASSNEPRWRNRVAWARNFLKDLGFINASEWNVWQITQAGRDWLEQNPHATHMKRPLQRRELSLTVGKPKTSIPSRTITAPPGITLDKLERIRQVMSADEFKRDWGEIYDQLLAAERAKSITHLTDRHLLERVRPLVQRIQDFLQGRSDESPKSEVICDWIFLCYTLELFREGAALWRYVNQDEVNAWQYERAAKFSAACRARIG